MLYIPSSLFFTLSGLSLFYLPVFSLRFLMNYFVFEVLIYYTLFHQCYIYLQSVFWASPTPILSYISLFLWFPCTATPLSIVQCCSHGCWQCYIQPHNFLNGFSHVIRVSVVWPRQYMSVWQHYYSSCMADSRHWKVVSGTRWPMSYFWPWHSSIWSTILNLHHKGGASLGEVWFLIQAIL